MKNYRRYNIIPVDKNCVLSEHDFNGLFEHTTASSFVLSLYVYSGK